MATLFEGWLVGEGISHLRSVAQVLEAEILRLESLMSRHDPQAELARLNKNASHGPVQVERELFSIIQDCLDWYKKTEGYFDIGGSSQAPGYKGLSTHVKVWEATQRIDLSLPSLWLDLGGYGKGYTLDVLGHILAEFGIDNYFLNGGRSSCLAKGKDASGEKWIVGFSNEFQTTGSVPPLELTGGFSYSAINSQEADIVHSPSGLPLIHPLACVVEADTALEAEVWSTSLLAMGKEKGSSITKFTPSNILVTFFEPNFYEA